MQNGWIENLLVGGLVLGALVVLARLAWKRFAAPAGKCPPRCSGCPMADVCTHSHDDGDIAKDKQR